MKRNIKKKNKPTNKNHNNRLQYNTIVRLTFIINPSSHRQAVLLSGFSHKDNYNTVYLYISVSTYDFYGILQSLIIDEDTTFFLSIIYL